MENEFITLDLEPQNRFSHTQDVGLLNSFENVLTNKIICKLVLFWKKISKSCGMVFCTKATIGVHKCSLFPFQRGLKTLFDFNVLNSRV